MMAAAATTRDCHRGVGSRVCIKVVLIKTRKQLPLLINEQLTALTELLLRHPQDRRSRHLRLLEIAIEG